MRSRDVVGRRIVRVEQQREVHEGGPVIVLLGLHLDNGKVIRFWVSETESGDGYLVSGNVVEK